MPRIVPALAMLLMTVAAATPSEACSCVAAGPPCQDYWRADAVFVGQVTSIQRTAVVAAPFGTGRRVTFAVSASFRGVEAERVTIATGLGGGDCGYRFVPGQSYVVYATRRSDGTLGTGICSRTALLSKAADDVAYATALANGTAGEGGVTGRVLFSNRRLGQDARGSKPVAGTTVVVSAEGAASRVTTGTEGRFAAAGLPPGRYRVDVELPDGYYALTSEATVELPDARACADVATYVLYDGRVSGRVVDATGRPVTGLTVAVVSPARLEAERGDGHRTLTDRDGRFEFTRLPPGRFIVAVNPAGPRRAMSEPAVYFPGVTAPEMATTGTLGPGARVEIGTFTLPPSIAYVPVAGVVLGPEGLPAVGAKVYLKLAGEQGFLISEPAITAADGAFVLAALSGGRYELIAELMVDDDGRRGLLTAGADVFTAVPAMPLVMLHLRPPR